MYTLFIVYAMEGQSGKGVAKSTLDEKSLRDWKVSPRKAVKDLYIVLSVSFHISNEDIKDEMSKYGEVSEVREQTYRQWPSVANGHRTVSYKKVSAPIPEHTSIKGVRVVIRKFRHTGQLKNRCYACGGGGHIRRTCPHPGKQ